MVRYALVIDLRRCRGLLSCQVQCMLENGAPVDYLSPDAWRQGIDWLEGRLEYHNLRVFEVRLNGIQRFVPVPCAHCDLAPCVAVCSTKATYKRADGIVVIDYDKCIGCGLCVQACPYGARYVRRAGRFAGKADKCQLCYHLIERGEGPRCVTACPNGAIIFGDLDDPESEVSRLVRSGLAQPLFPEHGTGPNLYVIGGDYAVLSPLPFAPAKTTVTVVERETAMVTQRETVTQTVTRREVVTETKTVTATATEMLTETVTKVPRATAGGIGAIGLVTGLLAGYGVLRWLAARKKEVAKAGPEG